MADPGLLSAFYADDAVFEGLALQSAQLLNIFMKRGPDQGYFLDPAKSLFISDISGKEEEPKRQFDVEGLTLNFVSGSWYFGAYLGPQEELETWVKLQVKHGPTGLES